MPNTGGRHHGRRCRHGSAGPLQECSLRSTSGFSFSARLRKVGSVGKTPSALFQFWSYAPYHYLLPSCLLAHQLPSVSLSFRRLTRSVLTSILIREEMIASSYKYSKQKVSQPLISAVIRHTKGLARAYNLRYGKE